MFIRHLVISSFAIVALVGATGCSGTATGNGGGSGTSGEPTANSHGLLNGGTDKSDTPTQGSSGQGSSGQGSSGQGSSGQGAPGVAGTQGGSCQLQRISFATDVCAQCQEKSCCSAWQACDADLNCIHLYNCVSKCQDQACIDQCTQQNPNAVHEVSAIYQCKQNSCAQACQ